jgi:hypothetical protein
MKKHLSLVAGLALVAGLSTPAQAQPVTATGASPLTVTTYVTVTAPSIFKLTINDTSTAVSAPTETDFDNGYQDVSSAVQATVKSNRPYSLSISGGAGTWTGTGGARANKPVGDLLWGTGTPSTALTTSAALIGTASTTGNNGSSAAATLNYRINWGYTNDTPGTYTIPVVYTLTSP